MPARAYHSTRKRKENIEHAIIIMLHACVTTWLDHICKKSKLFFQTEPGG
jgi:hypothetical protein